MELHKLQYAPGAKKKRKRVGRGMASGNGKTAGRGHKGQQSRAGYSRHYGFEGGQMPLHRRLPKRGFNHAERWPVAVVNVDQIDRYFTEGGDIGAEDIIRAGLAKSSRGGVKVLGRGEITKKVSLKVQAISPSARAKIEAAGGSVEIIGVLASQAVPETATATETTVSTEESSGV